MTVVLNTSFPPGFMPRERKPSKLKILENDTPGPDDPKYRYSFSIKEFVVTDIDKPGLIELVLDKSELPKDIDKIYIHDFCCTNGTSMAAMEFKDASNQVLTGFGENTVHVGFEPKLSPRELINVGLIVAIHEHGNRDPILILCDPQVGNGPPLNGFYPALPLT